MIYTSTLAAIVSALAADAIDNTSKQAWQKLYRAGYQDGLDLATLARSAGGELRRQDVDCWVHARLHSQLKARHWDVLVARYSTNNQRRKVSIQRLTALVATHAPNRFRDMAVYTWAVPKMKGAKGKRSTDVMVLEDWFYDMSNWDDDAMSEQTKRRWRKEVHDVLSDMDKEAIAAAEVILQAEGLLLDIAA